MRWNWSPFWRRSSDDGGVAPPPPSVAIVAAPGREPEARQAVVERHAHALARLAARPDEPVALALAIPFCAVHCLHCDREVLAAQPLGAIDVYVEDLLLESHLLGHRIGASRAVCALELGGGTANELTETQLVRLVGGLHDAWRLPQHAAMSIDCDPRRASRSQLDLLCELGFGQVRFGVADLDPRVQQAIGRHHSGELVGDVCALARDAGFERIELALMAGLPGQDLDGWRRTLARVVEMAPERVTVQPFRHRPLEVASHRSIAAATLPDAPTCGTLQEEAASMLAEAGYALVAPDAFERRADEWWRTTRQTSSASRPPAQLGLGTGAESVIEPDRFWNETGVPAWRAALHDGRLPVLRTCRSDTPAGTAAHHA